MLEKNLFESTVETLDSNDHRMRAWLALLGCFTSVERSLRRRFATAFHSSLPRYDVLTALTQYPDGLTMGQLAAKLMVSKGNITGVVRRLQTQKYVQQFTSREDRRVQVVRLTAKGRQLWETMHGEYRGVIDSVMGSLTTAQARSLTTQLTRAQQIIDQALDDDEA